MLLDAADLRRKVREEIIRSAAILRPEELALTIDAILERMFQQAGGGGVGEPVAWMNVAYGDRSQRELHRTEMDAATQAKFINDVTNGAAGVTTIPLYASPPAGIRQSVGVSGLLGSTELGDAAASLLEVFAEDFEAKGDTASWSMASVMAEKIRAALADGGQS